MTMEQKIDKKYIHSNVQLHCQNHLPSMYYCTFDDKHHIGSQLEVHLILRKLASLCRKKPDVRMESDAQV